MFTYTGANEIDVLINCHSTCVPFYVVPSTTATGYITLSTWNSNDQSTISYQIIEVIEGPKLK